MPADGMVHDALPDSRNLLARKRWQKADAVFAATWGQAVNEQVSHGGKQVGQADRLLAG